MEWATVVKKGYRPQKPDEIRKAQKAGPIGKPPGEGNRIFLKYEGEIQDAVAVRVCLRRELPNEASNLIVDVRRTNKAIALHVRTSEHRQMLRVHKDTIIKASGC